MIKRTLVSISSILFMSTAYAQIDSQSAESLGWATSASTPVSTPVTSSPIVLFPTKTEIALTPSSTPTVYKEAKPSECNSWECDVYVPTATLNKQMNDIKDLIPAEIRDSKPIAQKASPMQTVSASSAAAIPKDRFIIEYDNVADEASVTSPAPIRSSGVTQLGRTSYADAFMSKRYVGAKFGKFRCAEGLRNTLEKAGIVKRNHPKQQGHAKDWGIYLTARGNDFKNLGPKSPLCKTPGVIRVYGPAKKGYSQGAPGDTSGHVEIVGTDGRYYSSYRSSANPINERIRNGNNRRPLTGCYIKETELL